MEFGSAPPEFECWSLGRSTTSTASLPSFQFTRYVVRGGFFADLGPWVDGGLTSAAVTPSALSVNQASDLEKTA